jgi:hypothetical protein
VPLLVLLSLMLLESGVGGLPVVDFVIVTVVVVVVVIDAAIDDAVVESVAVVIVVVEVIVDVTDAVVIERISRRG